jgi:hypothetical protein
MPERPDERIALGKKFRLAICLRALVAASKLDHPVSAR